MTKKLKLTRDLVNRLPEKIEDPGMIDAEKKLVADNYHETTATDIISKLGARDSLWVFAIGSLIWKPRFEHDERRPAMVHGWQRSFCIGPDTRYRGNPQAPGLMLSLDIGGQCEGIVFRLPKTNLGESVLGLLKQEPPVPPVWVDAVTPEGTVRSIAFVCPREFIAYEGGLDPDTIADRLSKAVGMWGSMPDYLLNTVIHLEDSSIHDPYLWDMQERVAERLEKMV